MCPPLFFSVGAAMINYDDDFTDLLPLQEALVLEVWGEDYEPDGFDCG
jgi:hypothetical protein